MTVRESVLTMNLGVREVVVWVGLVVREGVVWVGLGEKGCGLDVIEVDLFGFGLLVDG